MSNNSGANQKASPIFCDPRYRFPAPPFSAFRHKIPGTEEVMRPRADHGENSYVGTGKLKGCVALISGGDSGIGRAVAIAYAREGADIVFTYFDHSEEQDALDTEALVKEAGQRVQSFCIDQSVRTDCEKVVKETINTFGRLDILINNAAFQVAASSIMELPQADLERCFKTNIESFYSFSRAALPNIPAGGSIINTSSMQAFDPSVNLSPYAATKAAIANFTLSLAKEAIGLGVRVNAVAPGPVWTPFIPSSLSEKSIRQFGEQSLLERPAQPAEIAPLYVFLASQDASFITAEIYGVTGGEKQF